MTEELNTALVVLGVGMITVIIILGLVVMTGDILIRIVNRFSPETAIKSPLNNPDLHPPSDISAEKNNAGIAAIVAAVDIITGGKGKANKIEKID